MTFLVRTLAVIVTFMVYAQASWSQGLTGLAKLAGEAEVSASENEIAMTIPLDLAVPYKVFQLADPWRIVLDSREIDWTGFNLAEISPLEDVRFGRLGAGWSRLVLTMNAPFGVESAKIDIGDTGAELRLALTLQSEASFRAAIRPPRAKPATQNADVGPAPAARRQPGEPLRILLDPGHGGIDPGAEVGGAIEADLMLAFALELAELLRRSGNIEVSLTRTEDVFVSLEARVAAAHRMGAHLFVSLHADIVTEGSASGASIYTLSDEASDIASQKLAERHDRVDLLSGVDLTEQDDVVAFVLMDMARTDTAHRSRAMATSLIDAMGTQMTLYKRPHQTAGFSVLKSPDIPSVLIELGFMSSKHDLKNIQDAQWRKGAAEAIRDGLIVWALQDEAEAELRRN